MTGVPDAHPTRPPDQGAHTISASDTQPAEHDFVDSLLISVGHDPSHDFVMDSLTAVAVYSQVQETYGVELPLELLLRTGSAADLRSLVEQVRGT